MTKSFLSNTKNVEIFTLSRFLSEEECEYLCQEIDKNKQRSVVSGWGEEENAYSQVRTSSSALFDESHPIIQAVNQYIVDELGIPLSYSEPIQGQLYLVGQEFKDHNDYFNPEAYFNHCLASGQRTWTVMIYLNEVEAGGHTEFPEIGKSIAPKKATALFWKNSDGNGTENPATIHCGLPVLKGKKYIITKWFREHPYQPGEDQLRAKAHHEKNKAKQVGFVKDKFGAKVKLESVNGVLHARYGSKNTIPQMTREGFQKMDIPKSLYHKILHFYYREQKRASPEFDPNGNDHIKQFISSKEVEYPTEIIQLTDAMRTIIFNELEDIHRQWSGRKISPTYCYGIRTYKRGAQLKKHTDGFETRVISSILNITQQMDAPWALQIDDHNGVEHEVFLQPGEMVLYESAVLSHGRVKPFNGDYYSNLFVHYVNLS